MNLQQAREFAKEQCEKFTLESLAPKTNFLFEFKKETKPLVERIQSHRRLKSGEIFDVVEGKFKEPLKRKLKGEYTSAFEVSNRILECQCPLNLDTYGGFCTFNCCYCFVLYYSQSLYSAYYDNWVPTYISVMNKEVLKKSLIRFLEGKYSEKSFSRFAFPRKSQCDEICGEKEVGTAFSYRIPLKIGNRIECFQNMEIGRAHV